MNAQAIKALAALVPSIADKLARDEAKAIKAEAKANKPEKKGVTKEEIAAHNKVSGNAAKQDTFGVYRPDMGRELPADAKLVQYGSAGLDSEALKMLESIRAVVVLVSNDLDSSLATDREFNDFLASQGESIESLWRMVRSFDTLSSLCKKLEDKGEAEKAIPFAQSLILTAGKLHMLCGNLYAKAGEADVETSEVLAGEAGSFGCAVKTPEGFVALFDGDAPLPYEGGAGTA